MRKALFGIAALLTASAAQADVTIGFGTPTGDQGTSHVYSNGGYSVTATGCGSFNFTTNSCTTSTHLFGKNDGSDEFGVGLTGDPSTNNEIWSNGGFNSTGQSAIILDVSSILSAGSAQFIMNSTTAGETWGVLGFNGTTWFGLLTGTTEGSQALPGFGTYSRYGFVSLGTNFDTQSQSFGNVLLSSLILPSVPEPATWAMMLMGFAGIGFAMRRRGNPALAQLA